MMFSMPCPAVCDSVKSTIEMRKLSIIHLKKAGEHTIMGVHEIVFSSGLQVQAQNTLKTVFEMIILMKTGRLLFPIMFSKLKRDTQFW